MNDLEKIQTNYSVIETVNRLIKKIDEEGWHLFASIDHAAQAHKNGMKLRPTQVVLFGNPKIGTLLMQNRQTSAIDLPAKALVWEDENGESWVAYNSSNWLKQRHQLTDEATVTVIGKFLEKVCRWAATG